MYVKWVVRRHKNEELANINFYDAYLVQSYKNSAGDPRQRTIAYLGNLRQINGLFPVIERALFYIRMEDALGQTLSPDILTEDERAKLYAGLSAVASPPSEEEIRQGAELNNIWHSRYWQARALKPSDASAGFAQFEMETEILSDEHIEIAEVPLGKVTVVGRLNIPRQNKHA
jgi:hypothetical protein